MYMQDVEGRCQASSRRYAYRHRGGGVRVQQLQVRVSATTETTLLDLARLVSRSLYLLRF